MDMDEKKRMQVIAENITYYRKQRGITQKELAKEVGITPSTMTDYMKLRSAPSFGVIQKLADFFGIKKSDIDTTFKEEKSTIPSATHTQPPKTVSNDVLKLDRDLYPNNHKSWIRYGNELLATQTEDIQEEPLYEYRIYEKLSAGTGSAIYEDHSYDLAYFDKELDHDIASWIYGDSMEPKYHNGQVALIKETGFDYDGAIYAVVWDGQTYIKKVYKEEDGLRLVSLNSKYDDKFARWEEEPRIIGKVVGNFMPMER